MNKIFYLFFSAIFAIILAGCNLQSGSSNFQSNASGNQVISSDMSALADTSTVNPVPMQVEFMASKVSWTNSEYVGHAFMCISMPVSTGSKEDCYGFYPVNNSIKGFVGGPGVTQLEFQKNPSRFTRVTVSLKKPINEEQRRRLLRLVDQWNNAKYDLLDASCIDLVNEAAAIIGLNRPQRVSTDLPEAYLRKLVAANP
jgi:hypothetical protein